MAGILGHGRGEQRGEQNRDQSAQRAGGGQRPLQAYLLSALLVGLTTLALAAVQRLVDAQEPNTYVRPFIGLYLLPVLLTSRWKGRLLGLFTLGLSVLMSLYFLLPPFGWRVEHPSDWMALALTTATGIILVNGLDALQQKGTLIAAVAEAQQENARIQLQTKEAQARWQSAAEARQAQGLSAVLPHLLLPDLPDQIPGLDLRLHYHAPSDPAATAMPFFDVFYAGHDRLALVVGRLSGSGAAAGAGAAAIRHMLRFALTQGTPPADAVIQMNAVFRAQRLPPDPCALFVGLYGMHDRSLTYAACGRVLSAVRRGGDDSAAPEELAATGPELPGTDGCVYQAATLALAAGDAVLLGAATDPHLAGEVPAHALGAQQIIRAFVQEMRTAAPGGMDGGLCLVAAVVGPEAPPASLGDFTLRRAPRALEIANP